MRGIGLKKSNRPSSFVGDHSMRQPKTKEAVLAFL